MGINALLDGAEATIDYVNNDIVNELGTLVTTIFGWVTDNPLLTVFLTASIIFLGFRIVGALKGVVRIR